MDTPALYQLMGAYFHQDWDLDGTEDQVIDAFLAGEPQFASLVAGEIETVLRAHPTERHLEQLLDDLGGSYRPDSTMGSYQEFLTRIVERARSTSAGGT